MNSILFILLFFFGCQEPHVDISGCPYLDSCNYNIDGTDEESCWYANDGCLCSDGNGASIDECNICNGDNSTCSDCAGVPNGNSSISIVADWDIQIKASMSPWNLPASVSDSLNYLGIKSDATDKFDFSYDTPDPPEPPGNHIVLYFPHSEWDYTLGGEEWSRFTADYKSNEICNFKEWNIIVKANTTGNGQLNFIYQDVPNDLIIELISSEETINITDDISINISLDKDIEKEFVIKVSTN